MLGSPISWITCWTAEDLQTRDHLSQNWARYTSGMRRGMSADALEDDTKRNDLW